MKIKRLYLIIFMISIGIMNMFFINNNIYLSKFSAETNNLKSSITSSSEVVDISKTQTIEEVNKFVSVEELIGRYQFNIAGAGVEFYENAGTKNDTGASHIDICAPFEAAHGNFGGNSSASYLDSKYNQGGEIYKAYLVVEMTVTTEEEIKSAAQAPVTLLYGGESEDTIVSGIKSTCSNFYYTITGNFQGTGWIDVTDFVKENGYGWYYGCNIPFITRLGDDFSSWKLIVIEENSNIPIRKLVLSLGNYSIKGTAEAAAEAFVEVSGPVITTKKTGTVTGQLLYGITNTDTNIGANSVSYTMDDTNYTDIITTNGVRKANAPLCLVMSRNGEAIKNKVEWDNHFYYTKTSESQDDGALLVYTTTNTGNYPEATGSDMELIDVDGTTSAHNVIFENNKESLKLRFSVGNYYLITQFLGIAVDIDCPEYTTVQSAIVHDENYTTISGTTTNTSVESAGLGIYDGKITVKVDDGLVILSTEAYFTDENGNITYLTEDMYTIDYENNTVTYIFGDDAEGRSITGESLTYTIETLVIESDNNDDKKYKTNNEVTASGYFTTNNIDVDIYMNNIVWDNSEVVLETPASVVTNDLVVNPNGGIYNNTTENTVYTDVQSLTTKELEEPTKLGYKFTGWTIKGTNAEMNPKKFIRKKGTIREDFIFSYFLIFLYYKILTNLQLKLYIHLNL